MRSNSTNKKYLKFVSGDAAKMKWKNLRNSYMKFKKSVKGETEYAKKYCKWPWSSRMSFLDATQRYRPSNGNIKTKEIENENCSSSEPTSHLTNNNDDSNNKLHASPEMFRPFPPKKKRKSHGEIVENIHSLRQVDKVVSFLQSKKSQDREADGIDHLFLSYAATFKTFRPKTQAMLKLKLATLFSETELNELQEQGIS